jgi:hypothetical protein
MPTRSASSLFSFLSRNSSPTMRKFTESPVKGDRSSTMNVVFKPETNHRRTIMFVFDSIPIVYDKTKYREKASERTLPKTILNTPLTEYFQRLCEEAIDQHLSFCLKRDISSLDIVAKNRLEAGDTLTSWIESTCFVFTYFSATYVSSTSDGIFTEKTDTA